MGIVCVGFNTGILLGPPLIGAIVQLWGWNMGAVAVCVFCLAAAAVLRFVRIYQN
jgi:predicted MFS family arabinose efflux permease